MGWPKVRKNSFAKQKLSIAAQCLVTHIQLNQLQSE